MTKKLTDNELIQLIGDAHRVLDRLDKALQEPWFEEEEDAHKEEKKANRKSKKRTVH